MRWMKSVGWLCIVASSVILAGCGIAPENSNSSTGPLPDVPSASVAGLDRTIQESKGKVVLIDFWATWCGYCVEKYPSIVRLDETYRSKGLVCIGASLDRPGQVNKVRGFLQKQHATFPNVVLLDWDTEEGVRFMNKRFSFRGGIPLTVLFDKAGQRVWDSSSGPDGGESALAARIYAELAK